MKYGMLILILVLLIVAAGCTHADVYDRPMLPEEKIISVTVEMEDRAYTITGAEAETLMEILQNCQYDPMKVCKCLPPIFVTFDNGTEYGINLSDGYARSRSAIPQGQADLTEAQLQTITAILEKKIDNN